MGCGASTAPAHLRKRNFDLDQEEVLEVAILSTGIDLTGSQAHHVRGWVECIELSQNNLSKSGPVSTGTFGGSGSNKTGTGTGAGALSLLNSLNQQKKRLYILDTPLARQLGVQETERMSDSRWVRIKMPGFVSQEVQEEIKEALVAGKQRSPRSQQDPLQYQNSGNPYLVEQYRDNNMDPFTSIGHSQLREEVAVMLERKAETSQGAFKSCKRMAKELRENNRVLQESLSQSQSQNRKQLQSNNIKFPFAYIPSKSNLFEWKIALRGPQKSPYAHGVFFLSCNFYSSLKSEEELLKERRDNEAYASANISSSSTSVNNHSQNQQSQVIKYPFEPPILQFLTPIFHPNISQRGKICLNYLNDKQEWTPMMNVESLCIGVDALLQNPNCEDPLNKHASDMLLQNEEVFRQRAREWTVKHGGQFMDIVAYQEERKEEKKERMQNLKREISQENIGPGSNNLERNPLVKNNIKATGSQGLNNYTNSNRTSHSNSNSYNLLTNHNNLSSMSSSSASGAGKSGAGFNKNKGKGNPNSNSNSNSTSHAFFASNLDDDVYKDEWACLQTDSTGRVLTEVEASRMVRWEAAREEYRMKHGGGNRP